MINEPMIILITLIISYFILQPVFIFFCYQHFVPYSAPIVSLTCTF